ncbi:MAG: hypothetical protein ACE5L6_07290 [Candidatus Bathyarchaeia archaeon]
MKTAEIEESAEPTNVEGAIETNPTIKEASVCRELVDIVKDLKVGDSLKNKDFSDRLELTSHSLTSIEVL